MEKKTVDVIIPAYRPGEGWKQMLRGLEGQTWPVHRLIVMNTGKENWKVAYEKTTIPMEVHHLTREEFDHGKTRDQAARMSRADYLLFMTQDALPEDRYLIETLVEAIEQDIIERDYRDMHRELSPLKQAEDAILLDTSALNFEEVMREMEKLVEAAKKKQA